MIKSYIPRVIAVNDLSGFGRVSLTESIPILSAMGVEVCPLPTAILSTHTYHFKDYTFCDLTEEMPKILNHWQSLDINFDGICTGYMGSARQIEILATFIKTQKKPGFLTVIDPVLGDNALSEAETVYYDRMNDLLCAMKKFVTLADVITPNLTEACLLLDIPFPDGPISDNDLFDIMEKLSALGPKCIAVTSVMTGDNKMCVGVLDKTKNEPAILDCSYVKRPFHGTGDIFAAVLTGALLRGCDMLSASQMAVDFVRDAISETMKHPDIKIEHGSVFEPNMAKFFSVRFAKETERR
ncbi:MAG: pyridoxamine kinase [Clostridia bacterium]|nr:pyridoxamine kinase [Clostridia bacterium]